MKNTIDRTIFAVSEDVLELIESQYNDSDDWYNKSKQAYMERVSLIEGKEFTEENWLNLVVKE